MNRPKDERPPLSNTPARPFGMADAMILVGAAAVGFALARTVAAYIVPELPGQVDGIPPVHAATIRVLFVSMAAYPVVAVLTAAAVVLRLRRPRPSLQRLARQPGFLACLAVSGALLAGFPRRILIANFHWNSPIPFGSFLLNEWMLTSEQCGYTVIGVWTSMTLLGRWRPEGTWIDRLGIALGGAWIAAVVIRSVSIAAWFSRR